MAKDPKRLKQEKLPFIETEIESLARVESV
jgi:hypothetical protein